MRKLQLLCQLFEKLTGGLLELSTNKASFSLMWLKPHGCGFTQQFPHGSDVILSETDFIKYHPFVSTRKQVDRGSLKV